MAIARNGEAIGIIRLKDVMKEGIKEKIQAVKTLGIRPVMITGDQPLTAKIDRGGGRDRRSTSHARSQRTSSRS